MRTQILLLMVTLILYDFDAISQDYVQEREDYIEMLESFSFSFSRTLNFSNHTVLVYHYPFDLGKSRVSAFSELLLVSALDSIYTVSSRPISKITVYGHTDLFRALNDSFFDTRSICDNAGYDTNSNECLGLTRSTEIHEILRDYLSNPSKSPWLTVLEDPEYHHDFFLNECNSILGDSLYQRLNIDSLVNHFNINVLGLSDNRPLNSRRLDQIRGDSTVQENIVGKYRLFSPFRSVLIINTHE